MELELWQAALLTLTGVLAGFLNVMAGGGSLLTVPVMVFLGLPGPVANGTNRIAILAQNVTASITFFKRGYANLKLSMSLAACAIPGAIVGALAGVQLQGPWFNRALALIMLGVMAIMYFDRGSKAEGSEQPLSAKRLLYGHILMIGVGFWGGFIQIGVGFLIMPVLNRVIGLNLVHTNVHKVFIIACYTIVALLVYASQVPILWIAGLALAVGTTAGGYLGAHFTLAKGEQWISRILNAVLIVFIIKLLFFS